MKSYEFDYPLKYGKSLLGMEILNLKKISKNIWGLFSTKNNNERGVKLVSNYNKQPYFIKKAGKRLDLLNNSR